MKTFNLEEYADFFDPQGLFSEEGVTIDELAEIGEPLSLISERDIQAMLQAERTELSSVENGILVAARQAVDRAISSFLLAGVRSGRLNVVADRRDTIRTRINPSLDERSTPGGLDLEAIPKAVQKNVPRRIISNDY